MSADICNKVSQQLPLMPAGRVLRHSAVGHDALSASASSSSGLFSLTYEPYYGLKEKAFSLSADPRFLFRSTEHAPAFDELLNGIRRREGLITLTGEIGTGKTTLIRSVLQHLDRRTFSAFVPDPFVSREDLLKMLLVDFGVVSIADLKRGSLSGASRPDLSYPLYEFLDSLVPLQAFAVLIIDEAQNLPLPLLEEIRILSDLEGREKLLQVVLVGQPELRAHLKLPEMRQVAQRVSVRCELTPLGHEGVAGYIDHRLRIAGDADSRAEFSSAAIEAVYEASKGTPRLINLICDRALHRGFSARVEKIEPQFIWDAITDLGLEIKRPETKAPAPAVAAKTEAPRTAVIASPPPELVAPAESATLQLRSAVRVPTEGELLTDFAPERNVAPPPAHNGAARGWMLVGASILAAALATAGMYGYLRVQSISELPALTFPAPPHRVEATLPTVIPPGSERFAIQVASFQTMTRAERLVEELTIAGYRARAAEVDLGERGRFVAVLVGDYRIAEDANPDLAVLRSKHGFTDAQVGPYVRAVVR
jgi:type II secretory pathway predicted ATPase ExeA